MKKPIPFGKYLLLERINVGGMAEVFKAKAFGVEGFERLVAVKRILPSIAEDLEFIQMFIDEAKIAVQLTHANIAQIFDLGRVTDSYFIAMEYMNGKDLRAIFDRARKRGEPLPVPMACYVVMKVCEGLDYAHNKKDSSGRDLHLVHRDVSPQNILISYDGEVKIIDFGIAKAAGKAGKTQAGILKGKFGYMSPEQVRGLPLDRRSDIFALGICLYELLTGERLFVGESDFSTLEKVRNVEIMPPSTYNRRIPEELEQIVLKALARDVDDRYQTAMDLHDDLQSFMYTSGNFFARKDLSAFMRKAFSDEIAKETARDEEYRRMEMPASGGGVQASGLEAFDDLPPSHPGRAAANISEAGRPSQPKRTMMGMGAVPPPPPSAGPRTSGVPPPPPPRSSRPSIPGVRTDGGPTPAPAAGPPPSVRSSGGATLDMDWDDEELSTQIYDKPEMGAGMVSGVSVSGISSPTRQDSPRPRVGTPAPGPYTTSSGGPPPPPYTTSSGGPPPPPPYTTSSGGPPPPSAVPTMPGTSGVTPPIAGPPAPVPRPSFPGGSSRPPSVRPGAPSPFIQVEQPRREPTEATRTPKKSRGAAGLLVAAAVVVFLGVAGAASWFLFFGKTPGTIQVTTTPADPVVVFDEQRVAATSSPFVIPNVEPDTIHLLEVQKPGFRPWSMQIEITPGQTLVLPPVALVADGAAPPPTGPAVAAAGAGGVGTGFTLESEPSGAKVFVDGRELSERTPVRVTDIQPGSHTVRVENGTRYQVWQRQIEVARDQVIAIPRVRLELATITVSFASTPPGAAVTLVRGTTRRNVGTTPASADVEVGEGGAWSVEMALTGYEPWSRALEPLPGQEELAVSAELARRAVAVFRPRGGGFVRPRGGGGEQGGGGQVTPTEGGGGGGGTGTLRVNSRPWSQIFVDGRLIGNTPQMNIPLSPGSHQVTFVNPEFNIRETRSVNIQPGETELLNPTLNPG